MLREFAMATALGACLGALAGVAGGLAIVTSNAAPSPSYALQSVSSDGSLWTVDQHLSAEDCVSLTNEHRRCIAE